MASKLMEMIEKRTKPVSDENFGKVSSHWKLIRDSVQRGEKEDPYKVDKKQLRNIGHGVHKLSTIKSDVGFSYVAFNPSNCQYTGISPDGQITLYSTSGVVKHVKRIFHEPLCGIVYAAKTKEYVGWGIDENIRLMTEDFTVLSSTSSISRIMCGIYNESANEVITGGVGNITCWSFRYGAKFLLQRKIFTDGLSTDSVISHICLEETPSRTQRCFSSYETSIVIHSVLDGRCLAHFKDLHSREITALLFFNPLKYLVTAARDGAIKVWNEKGNIQIIFVGHLKSVNSLAIYPYGPYIMSGSSDKTIRVWSLDTSDEVDRINTKGPVLGLGTMIGKDHLFSYSCDKLHLWQINHVHSVYTTVGSKVKSMKPSSHPRFSVRMVCTCSDNTVRLISPGSGACITTLLVPAMTPVTDVVYAAAENILFTLLSNGTILKASTKTNPCKITSEWNKESTRVLSTCSCLCLYEYVVEDNLESNQWSDLVRSTLKASQTSVDTDQYESVSKPSTYDRTILLGGCVDGTIVVFDWQNKKKPGAISFLIEAHREEIVTMIANPAVDQVISGSYDNTIKIWRLFPFAEEALAPLMTLYCQETPKHLAVAHHRLFVSLHEPATASYNVVVFKTTQKERFDHNSDNDHTDDVTGVASCPKMRLFASSSVDGSVRIWDESNNLLRVVTLNAVPSSLCFCSQKGDLLVGIGNHLHKIGYATYMPRSYIYRMVAMEFQRPVSENPLPIDPVVKKKLSPDELQRLTRAKSSIFKFERFADLLSPEEMDEKAQEEERRSRAFAKIRERENELKKLRDGVFQFEKRKPRPNSRAVQEDAFNRYLAIFYKRPDVQIPEEDDREDGPEYEEPDTFTPEHQPVGFFGIKKRSMQESLTKKEQHPTIKQEIMSLSMPEFQPMPLPPQEPQEEQEEEDGREFVVSRQGTQVDLEAAIEAEKPDFSSRRSHTMFNMKTESCTEMAVEPPLIGSSKRHQYIVDVPKTEQYPSSTMCRHLVARQATHMFTRRSYDCGHEEFVIAPDGYLPNSVIVSLFKDLKAEPPQEVKKEWRPPSLTAEQLAEIEKRKKKRIPTPEEEPPQKEPPKKKVNRFTDKMFQRALQDTPSPVPEPEIDLLRSPTPTPPPSPSPKEPTPPPTTTPKPSPPKPLKPIEKFVSRPKLPTPPPNLKTTPKVGASSPASHTSTPPSETNESHDKMMSFWDIDNNSKESKELESIDKKKDYDRKSEIISNKLNKEQDAIVAMTTAVMATRWKRKTNLSSSKFKSDQETVNQATDSEHVKTSNVIGYEMSRASIHAQSTSDVISSNPGQSTDSTVDRISPEQDLHDLIRKHSRDSVIPKVFVETPNPEIRRGSVSRLYGESRDNRKYGDTGMDNDPTLDNSKDERSNIEMSSCCVAEDLISPPPPLSDTVTYRRDSSDGVQNDKPASTHVVSTSTTFSMRNNTDSDLSNVPTDGSSENDSSAPLRRDPNREVDTKSRPVSGAEREVIETGMSVSRSDLPNVATNKLLQDDNSTPLSLLRSTKQEADYKSTPVRVAGSKPVNGTFDLADVPEDGSSGHTELVLNNLKDNSQDPNTDQQIETSPNEGISSLHLKLLSIDFIHDNTVVDKFVQDQLEENPPTSNVTLYPSISFSPTESDIGTLLKNTRRPSTSSSWSSISSFSEFDNGRNDFLPVNNLDEEVKHHEKQNRIPPGDQDLVSPVSFLEKSGMEEKHYKDCGCQEYGRSVSVPQGLSVSNKNGVLYFEGQATGMSYYSETLSPVMEEMSSSFDVTNEWEHLHSNQDETNTRTGGDANVDSDMEINSPNNTSTHAQFARRFVSKDVRLVTGNDALAVHSPLSVHGLTRSVSNGLSVVSPLSPRHNTSLVTRSPPTSGWFVFEGSRQNRRLVRPILSPRQSRHDTRLESSVIRPTPPREATPPPPPPTPLPEFITQFKGTLWFEKFFPDAQPDTFPRPWCLSTFVDILLQVLQKCTEYELKTQILAAILLLNRQDPFEKSCCERVSRTLLVELNVPEPPTAHGPSDAKQFIRVCLQLLLVMKIWIKSFVAELMAQYIDGDEDVRRLVQELFVSIEIRDPDCYFPKELDNFETEHLVDNRRKARIRELCLNWLERWLTQFKQHIKSVAGKIGRAQSGSVVKGTKNPKTPTSIKGILKKDDNNDASKSKVKFDIELMGKQAADSATPVEAINYFCEMQMEAQLEMARERSRIKTPQQAKDNSRNTVLILPKIHSKRSLVRLGETHCSHCHPERETSLSLAFPLPPIYQNKKEIPLTNVALHLKTLTLNPFPDEADVYLYEPTKHAQLLTLRSSQKYFIPSQSVVPLFSDSL